MFHDILSSNPSDETREVVRELVDEHGVLSQKVEEFEKLVYGEMFPLSKEKVQKIVLFLDDFANSFAVHIDKEYDKILPILKLNGSSPSRVGRNI